MASFFLASCNFHRIRSAITHFFRAHCSGPRQPAAVGVFAIGALANGGLAVRRGRVDNLAIGNLKINRLPVESWSTEELITSPESYSDGSATQPKDRQVSKRFGFAVTVAPRSISKRATISLRQLMARRSGVSPLLSVASIAAPQSSKAPATPT